MVPDEWKKRQVSDICKLQNGNSFKPKDWDTKGLPIIRIQNLNGSKNFNYYSGEPLDKWLVETGQLLFSWAGTRGVSFGPFIWKGPQGVLNQHIYKVFANDYISIDWLYLILKYITINIEARAHGFKATLLHVQKKDIDNQSVLVPPFPEQKKIAQILSTWDKAISTTQALIENSQQQKKNLMQQLLTGKKRFPGFEGEWEILTFKDTGIIITDGDRGKEYPKSDDFFEKGYCLFLSAKNVTKSGFKFNETQFIRKEKHNKLRKGIVNRGNLVLTTRGSVGHIALFDNSIPFDIVRVNSGMVTLTPNLELISANYLFFLCKSSFIQNQINRYSFGSAQPQLTIKIINKLKLYLPSLPEQQKVAQILTNADKEIELLQKQLADLKQEKKALMQQLLTGKRRVKIDTLSEAAC